MNQEEWWAIRRRVAVPPLPHRGEYGPQVAALSREAIVVARRSIAVGPAFEDARSDEVAQTLIEHIARDPEALLELIETRHPEEGVAHDQHRPPLAHHFEALGHRTVHVRETLALHLSNASGLHDRTQWATVSLVKELTVPQHPQGVEQLRRREVTWDDPQLGAALALEMSGLDYLRAVADGSIARPPVAALLGMGIERIDPGRATFGLVVGEHLYNPIGSVHGGIFATLLDSAMGCAVHSTLAAGQAYTTLELKINLVKALTLRTPKVTAEGEVITAGRRVATASGRLVGPDGTLFAHATTTCLIFDVTAPQGPPAAHEG